MTTKAELELQLGAKFYAEIECATSQTGRTHRAMVRVDKSTITTKMDLATGDGITIDGTNDKLLILQKGATVTELIVCPTDSAIWVFDCESTGATADDVVREAEGSVVVTRDVTRTSEATADADASKLLTYSLTDGQTLTSEEQELVRDKIGAGSGGTGAVRYDVVQSLDAGEQLQGRENLNAASADSVSNLIDAVNLEFASIDSELSAKANSSHTHTLGDIVQSGATSGQVAQWSGSAWVPVTPSAGSPGGADTTIQYNNAGAFAGAANLRIVTSTVSGLGSPKVIAGPDSYSGYIVPMGGGMAFGRLDEVPPSFACGQSSKLGAFVGVGGGFWLSTSSANLLASPAIGITKTSDTLLKVELAAGGAGDLEARAFNPGSMADGSAPVNSIYYSTTAGKLVYKDAGGAVNALY